MSKRSEPVDLGRLVRSAAADLDARSRERGVRVEVAGAGGEGQLERDAGLLSRAVENLLDNAIRHASPHGPVAVNWGCAGGEAFVSVVDDGPGIDAEDLPHIFQPLYRADESRSRRTGGSGLGLAIASRAVMAHGGRLEGRNREQRGAEFTIRLPAGAVSTSQSSGAGTT